MSDPAALRPLPTLDRDHPALSGRTGRGVTIAVIDSGVNVPHPHLPAVAGAVAFDLEGRTGGDTLDRLGHGTAVAAAIHEKAPDAEIWAVKVFDRVLATSVPALVAAIDWAAGSGIGLVNLSLGTPNAFRAAHLAETVRRAAACGTLVVSAAEHDGTVWYPGSLPGAVGVLVEPGCPRHAMRVEALPRGARRLRASPYPRPIPGVPPERNLNGISFAVANVTGLLALALEGRSGGWTAAEAIGAMEALAGG